MGHEQNLCLIHAFMDFVVSALNKLWSFAGFQPDKSNRTFISLKDIVNGLYSARR